MVFTQEFRDKKMMGHAFRIVNIQSNESKLAKKKCIWTTFFFMHGASACPLALTAVRLQSKIHDVDRPMYTLFTKFHS